MNIDRNFKFSWFSIIVLLMLIFLASYAWRPFVLGFYADDWALFAHSFAYFDLEELSFTSFFGAHLDRPGYAVLRYVFFLLWDGSLFSAQLLSCIIQAANVLSFATLLYFMPVIGKNKLAFFCGTCLYIVAPWTLGYTAWISASVPSLCSMFFSLASLCVILYHDSGKLKYFLCFACLMAASVLTYQAYLFLFFVFPFLFVSLLYCEKKSISFRRLITILIIATIITVIIVIFNQSSTPKSVDFAPSLWLRNVFTMVKIFAGRNFQVEGFLHGNVIMVLLAGVFAICGAYWFKQIKSNRQAYLAPILCACILIAGLFAALLPISLTPGYKLYGTGPVARLAMAATIWLSFSLAALVCAIQLLPLKLRSICFGGLVLYLMACSLFLAQESSYWGTASREQERILSIIQQEDIEKIDCSKKAFVSIDVPENLNMVTVFGADWDISSALYVKFKDYFSHCAASVAFSPSKYTSWDGKVFTTYSQMKVKTDNVYLYSPDKKIIRKVTEPFDKNTNLWDN